MLMKLITEITEKVDYLVEADGKDHFLSGRFIVGEERNKNGRFYPISVLQPEVNRYAQEMIKSGRALGECGHPSGPTINLERVSHIITELKQNGNSFDGKAKITNTPMGHIVKGLLESGARIGVSTRGMGTLKENNGIMEVQKDFKLAAIDCVSDPSGPGCFVNGIMEGVEYFYDPIKGTWKEEKVEELVKAAKQLTKEEREAKALALFEEYFAILAETSRAKLIKYTSAALDDKKQAEHPSFISRIMGNQPDPDRAAKRRSGILNAIKKYKTQPNSYER